MLIAIFGESCVGKTTLSNTLKEEFNASVFSGKDYLRLAKNEDMAKEKFKSLLLSSCTGENLIYVITEKAHLCLLPAGAIRILVTAPLSVIKERFSKRTGGILPKPIETVLEAKHHSLDNEPHDFCLSYGEDITEFIHLFKQKLNK